MIKFDLSKIRNVQIRLPNMGDGQNTWIFYGWFLSIALSLALVGYTLFFIEAKVVRILKDVDLIFALRNEVRQTELNVAVFEEVKQKWEIKKNLAQPSTARNPFY